MKPMHTICLCDADRDAAHPLAESLETKGFTLRHVTNGEQAVKAIIRDVPDFVLIEPQLPNTGGFEVCRAVRSRHRGPIVFWSSKKDEAGQLLAFELGADDFSFKPMSPQLLTARIQAHLNRGRRRGGALDGNRVQLGDLVMDAGRREVFLASRPIVLTSTQFKLLRYLVKRSGRVVTRQELYRMLFQSEYRGYDRSVDVYVSRLRNLLGDDAEHPQYLKTIRGVGYLFVDQGIPAHSTGSNG